MKEKYTGWDLEDTLLLALCLVVPIIGVVLSLIETNI